MHSLLTLGNRNGVWHLLKVHHAYTHFRYLLSAWDTLSDIKSANDKISFINYCWLNVQMSVVGH